MAAALSQSVGIWSASSVKRTANQKRTAARFILQAHAPLRSSVFRARLGRPSASTSRKVGVIFAAQAEDTPCEVSSPLEDLSMYDAFSVNDAATPARLTHVFDHPREIQQQYELGQ
eukprot:8271280-Pyramimonas_sp.AAC.1